MIFRDTKERIWIGTRNGINIFNKEQDKFVDLREYFNTSNFPDLANNRIYGIIEDYLENIWIGTSKGLYKLNLTDKTTCSYYHDPENNSGLSNSLIYSIIEDNEKNIWIGTINGLNKYDHNTKTFVQYKKDLDSKNTLYDNIILSLFEDSDGLIWIGTNNGVSKFNKKDSVFSYYSEKNGLSSNTIYKILEDNNNNIWFSTERGLVKFDKKNDNFKTFGVEDGLQGWDFNLNTGFKSEDGEMFFGGINGFNSFYPDSLLYNQFIPPIVLTSFTFTNNEGNHNINLDGFNEITLNYSDYAFEIGFAALEYSNPDQNQYAYKMEGLSDEWIKIANRRFVPFTNIPPGKYNFMVKGSNNDEVWNNDGTSIRIIIKAPWWQTNIAYLSYFIITIILVLLFLRIREKKNIYERNILEQKVKKRTSELAEKNNILKSQKEEILAQNEEIIVQRDLVTDQYDQLVRQKKSITDSINYALRIQEAIMPSAKWRHDNLPEHFILYKPKDIISGDFFWIRKINNLIVFAIADCTGHGVPGAMLSMMGVALLNEIVRKREITKANHVLNEMRKEIILSLNQKGNIREQKDGMDIALCAIDYENRKLQFAGANNPMVIIRDNKIINYKGDRMPIGISMVNEDFTNHEIDIYENDMIYLYTDGYVDQFGGNREKKFHSKTLRKMLLAIHKNPLQKQKAKLQNTLAAWQGDLPQIDDITILGLKIAFEEQMVLSKPLSTRRINSASPSPLLSNAI